MSVGTQRHMRCVCVRCVAAAVWCECARQRPLPSALRPPSFPALLDCAVLDPGCLLRQFIGGVAQDTGGGLQKLS